MPTMPARRTRPRPGCRSRQVGAGAHHHAGGQRRSPATDEDRGDQVAAVEAVHRVLVLAAVHEEDADDGREQAEGARDEREEDPRPPAETTGYSAMPRIMAPTFSAAVDSKRSAPRPAQSPTLSPTRSAITAGLRGSSSGMPASTLPDEVGARRRRPWCRCRRRAGRTARRSWRRSRSRRSGAAPPRGCVKPPKTAKMPHTPSRLMATTRNPETAPPRSAICSARVQAVLAPRPRVRMLARTRRTCR